MSKTKKKTKITLNKKIIKFISKNYPLNLKQNDDYVDDEIIIECAIKKVNK